MTYGEELHDRIFRYAHENGIRWLGEMLFNIEGAEGCNGVNAVAGTSRNFFEAMAKIESIEHGTLPPGIEEHNLETRDFLERNWTKYLEEVRNVVEAAK